MKQYYIIIIFKFNEFFYGKDKIIKKIFILLLQYHTVNSTLNIYQ